VDLAERLFSHVLYQLSYLAGVENPTLGTLRARYSTRCGGHIMGTARAHFQPVSTVGLCGLPRRVLTRTEAPLCPSCAHDGRRAHQGERFALPHGCDDYRQVTVSVKDERCVGQDTAAGGRMSQAPPRCLPARRQDARPRSPRTGPASHLS